MRVLRGVARFALLAGVGVYEVSVCTVDAVGFVLVCMV